MTQKRPHHTSTTLIETSPEAAPTPPPWFAGAVLTLRTLHASPLWIALCSKMNVPRGRTGHYVAIDFILTLLTFAVSDAANLREMYAQLLPVIVALPAVWSRGQMPSRSALSRFLRAVTPSHVTALAAHLLDDLIDSGIPADLAGGLYDRDGARNILFDDDGTYHGARQRELADDDARPPPVRRAAALFAKGYNGGSRRVDVTRTRTVLMQAHTQEWLGGWSAPGNGHPFAQIEDACAAVVRYLTARGMSVAQGLLRLDGLYGYPRIAAMISRHGLGYLMRCATYGLLRRVAVKAVIATPPHAYYTSPDSPVRREAWQVLALPWAAADGQHAVETRLIITRRPALGPGKPRVGKREGDWVYELFVTDRSPSGWSIEDVLSIYFGRGGFEGTLAQEDRERNLDRTMSWSDAGQSFWTLVGQLAWNLRVRMGVRLSPDSVRVTRWSAAVPEAPSPIPAEAPSSCPIPEAPKPIPEELAPSPTPPEEPSAPAPSVEQSNPEEVTPEIETNAPAAAVTSEETVPSVPPAVVRGRIAPAVGRDAGRFGGDDFVWTEEGHLRCPADKLLRRGESRRINSSLYVIYRARAADCQDCPLWTACRGRPTGSGGARSVSVIEAGPSSPPSMPAASPQPAPQAPQPPSAAPVAALPPTPAATPVATPGLGPRPVIWVDVAASAARRRLRDQLRGQRVEVTATPIVAIQRRVPVTTRDQRAHRRHTWQEAFERNQRPPEDGCLIRVYGVPPVLEDLLGTARHLPLVA